MAYFVTGATGFIGRFLVQELLDNREGHVYVLARPGSQARLERLMRRWGHEGRVTRQRCKMKIRRRRRQLAQKVLDVCLVACAVASENIGVEHDHAAASR